MDVNVETGDEQVTRVIDSSLGFGMVPAHNKQCAAGRRWKKKIGSKTLVE